MSSELCAKKIVENLDGKCLQSKCDDVEGLP